jgi:RNA recognition motif-containing protein
MVYDYPISTLIIHLSLEEPGGSGRSRGYAFVTMEDPKDAVDAVREVDRQ